MTARPGVPLDLAGDGRAVLWGLETPDLDVNLVTWPAGDGVAEHVNDQVDMLLVVVDGGLCIRLDGNDVPVVAGQAIVVSKGVARSITADAAGVTYLSAHRRRGPLKVGSPTR